MAAQAVDTTWMWHPLFKEERTVTAGLFVHFRRTMDIQGALPASLKIYITADTRYKLYVNRQLVRFGPVKGDSTLWFYDEVNLAPYLVRGVNYIGIQVLRFFYATPYASSFPRLPSGGVRITPVDPGDLCASELQSSQLWETAIDPTTVLRVDEPEDDFLHIYEKSVPATSEEWKWVPATVFEFQSSTGLTTPWKLSRRMIPDMRRESVNFKALHNIDSCLPRERWEETLLIPSSRNVVTGLQLPAESSHSIDLEAPNHVTAFLGLRFARPSNSGGRITLTYAEAYEDPPMLVPYLRCKGNRLDITKSIYGRQDIFDFQGTQGVGHLRYYADEDTEEVILPFHFRTFRFIRMHIQAGQSDLILKEVRIETVNYPLDVVGNIAVHPRKREAERLWETSVRTLINCMHDCYEDCPFYEQLQYAMDTRSSMLFTY
ncbi:hypothetical protein BJY01DRAFT_252029 [Aspergillus pseudoustus]|uniref:Alpha-L-rhamnosidase six-hairpin glycosidase domain-containing protein n=1 Tax=Aspergillus pseudoustus TaxID=1810923 RepID=A0ABR4J8A8_9EURO